MSVTCQIKKYEALKKKLENMKKAPETVIKRTVSDIKTRVPTWVAAEVTKVYNIKKSEVTPKKGKADKTKKAGFVRVKGETVDELQIVYQGRLLTPTHFGMSPKAPSASGSYALKATILKGRRSTLGKVKKLTPKQRSRLGENFRRQGTRNSPQSPWMLKHTGAKSADKVQFIPFQRQQQPGNMKYVFRTISMPQMVSNEKVAPNITKAINEGLEKRLAQHMKLLEK